jgi:hypothetical protein
MVAPGADQECDCAQESGGEREFVFIENDDPKRAHVGLCTLRYDTLQRQAPRPHGRSSVTSACELGIGVTAVP